MKFLSRVIIISIGDQRYLYNISNLFWILNTDIILFAVSPLSRLDQKNKAEVWPRKKGVIRDYF